MHTAIEIDKGHRGIPSSPAASLYISPRGGRNDRKHKPHQRHTPQHQRAPANASRQEGKGQRAGEAEHLAGRGDEGRVDRPGDAGRLEHAREVVRDEAVAGPLLADAAPDEDQGPPPVPTCGEEGLPRRLLGGDLQFYGLPDLFELVPDDLVVLVAGGVVLDQDCSCLVFLAGADQPPRGPESEIILGSQMMW